MSPSAYRQVQTEKLKRRVAHRPSSRAPAHWRPWCLNIFPDYFDDNFGERHEAFWEHEESIEPDNVVPAGIYLWPRGSGKSTTAETSVVRVGARKARRYCWYVCETQDQADKHVATIANMLESKRVAEFYPELSERLLGKNGNSKGWNRNMLRCADGYTVEAIGLNKAARGGKMDWARPDLIFFDDIDNLEDTLAAVEKKIRTITGSIMPAGSTNVAVFFVQNLIHPNSIAAQLAGISEHKADFLLNRIVSGPYPAIEGLVTEQADDGYIITGGKATWAGQDLEICQRQINLWGLSAFRREAQHEVDAPPGGIFSHLEYKHCTWDEVPWGKMLRTTVWVDPAVTSTDQSDSMGIQADGLADDGKKPGEGTIYRLWSWEAITTPEDALKRAILKALEIKADTVGVETDQGGDTWKSVYNAACQMLIRDAMYPDIAETTVFPKFKSAKAGAGHGSKAHRASQMLVDYEHGKFVHVTGTHQTLERALFRFPLTKPLDLTDACYWSWFELRKAPRREASSHRG